MHYFAFGMNLDPEMMTYVRAEKLTRGVLHGWELVFRNGLANIEPNPEAEVHGGVWFVPDRNLYLLDAREGYPYLYNRHLVSIKDPEGNQLPCVVYEMALRPPPPIAPPYDSYLDMIRRGYDYFEIPYEKLSRSLWTSGWSRMAQRWPVRELRGDLS